MERLKSCIKEVITFISALTTIIIALLPNDFPYVYRVIILAVLCVAYGLEILIWKILKTHRFVLVFSLFFSLFILAITASVYHFRPIELTSELHVPRNCKEILIENEVISSNTVNNINCLQSLTSISFKNCEFEEDVVMLLNLPQSITSVSLINCNGIADFIWLSHLANLYILTIENCGLSDENFPNLHACSIHYLNMDNNMSLSELKWLPKTDLESISFCKTSVSNLDKLAQCKSLKTICANNSFVSDLSPLANLTELRSISFNNCRIETVASTFMSLRLEQLLLSGNKITDCSGFQNFTKLVDVDLSNNLLTDVSWLVKSKSTLKSVRLSWNPIDSEHLLFLLSFSKLTVLGISGIKFDSIDFIENMKELSTLDAIRCEIKDISVIGKLNIKDIRLGLNNISDISPLITALENDKASHPAFHASYVPEFDFLDLSGNPIDKLNLEKLSGNTIILSYFIGLPDIEINFSNIYIVDCPLDKRVSIEDMNNGKEKKVFFITLEEALSVSLL